MWTVQGYKNEQFNFFFIRMKYTSMVEKVLLTKWRIFLRRKLLKQVKFGGNFLLCIKVFSWACRSGLASNTCLESRD